MNERFPVRLLMILCIVAFSTGCRSVTPAAVDPRRQPEQPVETPSTPQSADQILRRQIDSARELFVEGRYELSREILRGLEDPFNAEIMLLQARIALAQEDPALASFYLKKLLSGEESSLDAGQKHEAYGLLADLSYDSGDFQAAYRYYLETVNLRAGEANRQTWFRLAEIALLQRGDAEAARIFLTAYRRMRAGGADADRGAERLYKRLVWSSLSAEELGLSDANISALAVDGDDLWVGTWNGGICRYSIGQGLSTVFQEGRDSLIPRTVRAIEVTPDKVWIGTYQGLYRYSKATSHWQRVEFFDEKVEALCAVRDTLYVGTLGKGLWRSDGQAWIRVNHGDLPGKFINCLMLVDPHLLIGTLDLGLVILEPAGGTAFSFDSVNPALAARNIISLLAEDENTLWIGTYGEGLYRWNRDVNRIEHFTKASGLLADDWVLCAVAAESGLYFGTFGGGVSQLSGEQRLWRRIGLRQGLAALDISTAAYFPPRLFFGTLGSGISVLDESLVLSGDTGIQ